MGRLIETVARTLRGLGQAIWRFPLTVLSLVGSTALTCYMISLHSTPSLLIQKLMFVCLFAAFLGITAQFACERFPSLAGRRSAVYIVSVLFTLGYYLIIAGAPAIDYEVGARTAVAVFAMFCAFIWLPSLGGRFDFNSVALVHFKSAMTSILYAGVLSAGLAALIVAIDILLFDVDSDTFGYMLAIVWMLFATIHYLSLLPRFNSDQMADRIAAQESSQYPRILEILVAQIAIPLISAYTLVLLAYFVKIGVTREWPIGQLGPMILGYAAAGLLVYVLASRLNNRSAVLYQHLFPKVLIPVVIMQLVSVSIRLRAYGITESRYYLTLFGIFSLIVGIALSLRPVTRNGIIAVLAASLAIASIVPPVDAFTVSRLSQVSRLEGMLQAAGILVDGELHPQSDVDLDVRRETTNILNYLNHRGYLPQVSWLPQDFEPYRDMEQALGFEPTYSYMAENITRFYANLNRQGPLPISGYDVLLEVTAYRYQQTRTITQSFTVRGSTYRLVVERQSPQEARVSIQDSAGAELVATGLNDFVTNLMAAGDLSERLLGPEQMTLDASGRDAQLRIIFQSIHAIHGSNQDDGIDYNMFILVSIP
jgi:hypothetical protein